MTDAHSITIPDLPDEPLKVGCGYRHCDARSCIGSYYFDFICSICNESALPIPTAYLTVPRQDSIVGYTIELYRRNVNCINAYLYATIILSKNGKFISINPVTPTAQELF